MQCWASLWSGLRYLCVIPADVLKIEFVCRCISTYLDVVCERGRLGVVLFVCRFSDAYSGTVGTCGMCCAIKMS